MELSYHRESRPHMRLEIRRSRLFIILTCLLFAALAACGGVGATPSPVVDSTSTPEPATATAQPSATSEPPTATAVPSTATNVPAVPTASASGPDLSALSWQRAALAG